MLLGMLVSHAGDYNSDLVEFDPVCDVTFAEEYLGKRGDCSSITTKVDDLAPVIVVTCHEELSDSSLGVTPTGYFKMEEEGLTEKHEILCQDSWFVVLKAK